MSYSRFHCLHNTIGVLTLSKLFLHETLAADTDNYCLRQLKPPKKP